MTVQALPDWHVSCSQSGENDGGGRQAHEQAAGRVVCLLAHPQHTHALGVCGASQVSHRALTWSGL